MLHLVLVYTSKSGCDPHILHVQIKTLSRKFRNIYWRKPDYNIMRYVMTAAIALVLGTTYLNEGKPSDPADLQDIQSVMGAPLTSVQTSGSAQRQLSSHILQNMKTPHIADFSSFLRARDACSRLLNDRWQTRRGVRSRV